MIAKKYRWRVASDSRGIRLAQSVRWKAFGRECGYLDPTLTQGEYEQSPWDLHGQALHILIEDENGCVGAARLIIGRLRGDCPALGYGLPIEAHFDLAALNPVATCVAEIGRVCVLSDHRGRGAAQVLYRASARESLRRGATRWVGCANSEVQSYAAAIGLERRISALDLWADMRFEPIVPLHPAGGEMEDTELPELPPVLRSYVTWGGIRFAGRALFDSRFSRWAFPFVGRPLAVLQMTRSISTPDNQNRSRS